MTDWSLLEVPPLRDELAQHRRDHTFASHVWYPDDADPTPARKPLTATEVIEEAEWFLDSGVHPLMIAQSLGRKPSSIYRAALRRGNDGVRAAFSEFAREKCAA